MRIKITQDINLGGTEIIKAGSVGHVHYPRVHFKDSDVVGLPTGEAAIYDADYILSFPHEIIRKEG